jgi:hypothetical protein
VYVCHCVFDVFVTKEFHYIVDVSICLVTEFGCFPMSESKEMNLLQSWVLARARGKYEVFRKKLFLEKCASCFGNRQKLCVASTFPSRDSVWRFGESPKLHLYENCFVGGGMRQSQRAHRNPAQNHPLVWVR